MNYNVFVIGTAILLIYIVVDIIRNKTRNLLRRVIFYSFIFYLLHVVQMTTGGITFPPQKNMNPTFQMIPFYFVGDLFNLYRSNGLDWFFWNSFKLTFLNFLLLMPLGVYLSLLFNVRSTFKVSVIVFLVSFTLETLQFTLTYFGMIMMGREFNVDDLLINTLGGVLVYMICECVKHMIIDRHINEH